MANFIESDLASAFSKTLESGASSEAAAGVAKTAAEATSSSTTAVAKNAASTAAKSGGDSIAKQLGGDAQPLINDQAAGGFAKPTTLRNHLNDVQAINAQKVAGFNANNPGAQANSVAETIFRDGKNGGTPSELRARNENIRQLPGTKPEDVKANPKAPNKGALKVKNQPKPPPLKGMSDLADDAAVRSGNKAAGLSGLSGAHPGAHILPGRVNNYTASKVYDQAVDRGVNGGQPFTAFYDQETAQAAMDSATVDKPNITKIRNAAGNYMVAIQKNFDQPVGMSYRDLNTMTSAEFKPLEAKWKAFAGQVGEDRAYRSLVYGPASGVKIIREADQVSKTAYPIMTPKDNWQGFILPPK